MWGLFCWWSLFLIAQAIVVGVSMCGRYKMGRRYLAGDMLEPAPRAPQEWQCAEICARDPSQPLPPVAMLLSRSCERAAFLHLPAIFPRLLPAVLFPCPFFSMLPSPFWIQARCCSSMFCFYASGSWFLTCAASCSMWICVSEESQEGNQGVHPVFVHTA